MATAIVDLEDLDSPANNNCCGNGCVNCVLDMPPAPSEEAILTGRRNILLEYSQCELLSKRAHSTAFEDQVLELNFRVKALIPKETKKEDESAIEYMLDIPPGHHVMMRIPLPTASNSSTASIPSKSNKMHLRPYSPYEVDAVRMEFKILVNLKPQGLMSRHIAALKCKKEDERRVPDCVEFYGPIGQYKHQPSTGASQCLILLTQGVAIAPTIRIIEQILNNADDMTRLYHFACFTDLPHLYFRERLQKFRSYWNYQCHIYCAHQSICEQAHCNGEDCAHFRSLLKYNERVLLRRCTAADILEICESTANKTSEKVFIVSGSRAFQDHMSEEIHKFAFPKDIHLL